MKISNLIEFVSPQLLSKDNKQRSDDRRSKSERLENRCQVLFLLNQLIQPCQLNQPYIPDNPLLLHLPMSDVLLYALCPMRYAFSCPQRATCNPQLVTLYHLIQWIFNNPLRPVFQKFRNQFSDRVRSDHDFHRKPI